ncbi:MAG TPA: undecaprenyl-diphosphate phosphatase [Gemmatimonadaceae bacterium]|nr:undecaprenyl-diphosphate phosphatase [Gemmatimonadaceae bacterium]
MILAHTLADTLAQTAQAAPAASAPVSNLYALILGIVEGITEFLPVSSTAHLILASDLLHLRETDFLKSFEIIIQLGAILSVVVLYWSRFWHWDVFKKLVVAFIPTGIIGLAFYKVVKGYLLGNIAVVLWSLFIGGIALLVFERFKQHSEADPDFTEITYGKALLVGVFQAIAIIPGVSRSAATIVGGSLIGISKRTIVEFSFMLAVPTMLAASLLELYKNHSTLNADMSALVLGFVVSFIMAILAIKSFLAYLKKRDFTVFGWYRIVLAIAFYLVVVR